MKPKPIAFGFHYVEMYVISNGQYSRLRVAGLTHRTNFNFPRISG